jgi:hypothetical protein
MKEQERAANEEAEKRLKAALLTKREPGAVASRLASPSVGASANPDGVPELNGKQSSEEQPIPEDVSMEVETAPTVTGSNSTEVSFIHSGLMVTCKPAFDSLLGSPNLRHCLMTLRKLLPEIHTM